MNNIPYAEQLCSALDRLALPRAFVENKIDRFIAWNSCFLNALHISQREISALRASEVLCFEGGVEFDDGLRLNPCSAHAPAGGKTEVHGHAITAQEISFIMLDVGVHAGQVFQRTLTATVEKERIRFYRFMHDQISPALMSLAFSAESLAARLEEVQPEAAGEAVKMRRLLGDVFDKMHLLFAPPIAPNQHIRPKEPINGD
jgi:hypothetical protein